MEKRTIETKTSLSTSVARLAEIAKVKSEGWTYNWSHIAGGMVIDTFVK